MWYKKGLIFNVDGKQNWNKTHAQTPIVDVLDDRLRIYYSTRNANGTANISFIEVEKNKPENIIYVHKSPLLELGAPGTFDDSGIMPTSVLTVGELKYLYYIGWTTRLTVPYQNAIGLAISKDGGKSYQRAFDGPVITVNHLEPYFSGTAFVMEDNSMFKMWYLSCIKWEYIDGKMEPFYNLKYAESADGIYWNQTGKVAIELNSGEGGIASATVIKELNKYKMWYSYRGNADYRNNPLNSYRIGYAESSDGLEWLRLDNESGIIISKMGWDSEMICYPNVVQTDQLIMFYNGNGFGKTGFGYAIWK
jgi:hypothetical protein